jgi:hypothetical protein
MWGVSASAADVCVDAYVAHQPDIWRVAMLVDLIVNVSVCVFLLLVRMLMFMLFRHV